QPCLPANPEPLLHGPVFLSVLHRRPEEQSDDESCCQEDEDADDDPAATVISGCFPETCGIEQVELRRVLAEDRVGDELAAGEAEHVAVPGIAARDPERVAAGDAPDE